MAGLPKKYAKMGFKKGWEEYKKTPAYKGKAKPSKPRKKSNSTKKVKTVARRRRSSPKRKYSRKKSTSISVMSIGHMAMQYSNLTGQPLGSVMEALTSSLINGDTNILEIVMAQAQSALTNITENPAGVAIRGALIAGLWSIGRKVVGRKTLLRVGKFKITV